MDGEGCLRGLVRPPSLTHQAGHHRRIVELGTVGEKEFSCVVLLVRVCVVVGFCRFGFVFWVVFWL